MLSTISKAFPRVPAVFLAMGRRAVSSSAAEETAKLNRPLSDSDPHLFDIMEHEKHRQLTNLNLIPSENFTSRAVLDCLGSVMSNKYSEGYPGKRYYGGNEHIDQVESLCRQRALEAFRLDPEEWGVNVQPLSGSPANLMTYSAVLNIHDRVMALDLPHGGHLTHGFHTPTKPISHTSKYFEFMPYQLNPDTDLIDYDRLEANAALYHPKLIIGGFSAYARHVEYDRLRAIANQNNALLMSDMAHISGLVAADVVPSPFDHCDIVTTTTHKSLRGPRGAMIFFRKGVRSVDKKGNKTMYDLEDRINSSVFPGHQGGPHNHTIAALATALHQASSDGFRAYQQQVLANSSHFADELLRLGYKMVTGGTSNHLVLADLTGKVDGARVEHVLDRANFTVNKNTVPGDKSAMTPSGVRMGTPALTTRGFTEADFTTVAEFFHRGVELSMDIQAGLGSKKLKDFKDKVANDPPAELSALRTEVTDFAASFPIAGFDVDTMTYKHSK